MHKYIEHTADIQFICRENSLEDLFIECALAMKNSTCDDKITSIKEKSFSIKGHDLENLLYNFLEEILFISETENLIFERVLEIKISKNGKEYFLESKISFGDSTKYSIHLDVKAITYNEMYVREINNSWEAKVTLDV